MNPTKFSNASYLTIVDIEGYKNELNAKIKYRISIIIGCS